MGFSKVLRPVFYSISSKSAAFEEKITQLRLIEKAAFLNEIAGKIMEILLIKKSPDGHIPWNDK
ncbi:MAG: hypothetical protein ACE3JK_09300 [Sporolactobacillus sp.]